MLTFDQKLARWVNVAAAIGVVVTLGGWVVGRALNLPWFVGLLVGLVVWVVILNGFVTLGRRASPAADSTVSTAAQGEDNPRQSPSSTDPEDVEQLKRRLGEVEQERGSQETVIEKQQEQLNCFDGDRQRFKELLTAALLEGRRLRENEPSDDDVQEWKAHMRDLLVAALGEGSRVDSVLKDDPAFESAVHGSTSEQKQIERSTNRLHDLIEWVKSPQAIPFRSGFDPHEWEDWKSPPPTTERAQIERLQASLHEATWQIDSLLRRVKELEMMSPDEYRARQDQRRKRIERWRADIQAGDFNIVPLGGVRFAHTETYSEMRPFLSQNIRTRFESPLGALQTLSASPRKKGSAGDRRVLLDEVARIEAEWSVI
jgi:hypothetical protein